MMDIERDIERISKEIIEEKDNLVAKAFTFQISSLLLENGIVPIITEHTFGELETITDLDPITYSNRYKLVYELGITFDSLDTSKHDKEIYNKALDDFVKMCDEAKYIMFEQYTVDMRDIREFKKELSK